jgi:hypothetical protein
VVCQQAVAVLERSNASLRRWQMAAVAARAKSEKRYRARIKAMSDAGARSVIIEDLVAIGEEMGFERGHEKGLRQAALSVCKVLGIELSPEQRARLEALDGAALGALIAHLETHHTLPG